MNLRTHAIVERLSVGSLSNTFFNLLDRVEVWGGSIPKSTWKEFEHVQNLVHFLTKLRRLKKQTPYTLLLLERRPLLVEIIAMEMVVKYVMLKVQKVPHIDFLESHGKQAKRSKRHIKA